MDASVDPHIAANRRSWATIAEDHYRTFKERLSDRATTLSRIQIEELGDISGKKLIHLQCNTGADTISLARMGAQVTGVDLVPQNVQYARRLAEDFGIKNARFIESDVLEIADRHAEKYDIAFSTEGVLCWLPDLHRWARNVRRLLADDGFLYVLDGHPFFMLWDEERLPELRLKYPYFEKHADKGNTIGGYACERRVSENYSWMYTIGEIVNSLSDAGLHIEWFHEFDWLYFKLSDASQEEDPVGGWFFPEYRNRLPFTFSLKAVVR